MGYAAIPYIMMAVAAAGTAVSVYSTAKQGEAVGEARDREAAQLERSAAQSRHAAAQKAEDTRKEHLRIMAAARARYGASGLEMTGSPLLVQMESMAESQEELRRIIEAGELGYGTQMEAAGEASKQGDQSVTSGYVNAAGKLTQGVGVLDKIGRDYKWWGQP